MKPTLRNWGVGPEAACFDLHVAMAIWYM
jgi:hypothetical protein